ncbi:hypothetical protein PG985_004833 [Apiospora marii]|uniref:uncharacterized protein n=1 Tax=Apiospora marii TaxID=335849 RepID=UPI00312CC8CB
MQASAAAFYSLWREDRVRERLFEILDAEDLCHVRLASAACCNLVTKRLFLRITLTFRARTFMQQSRVQALSRIGHHIEHLTFYLPHTKDTFLPPLINGSGEEVRYLYAPYTSTASTQPRPKCANRELEELLTQQYPPLFHAASNVPSFIHAMRHVPNMRHLTIKTPGQNAEERYRRSIVDHALISLRIALERAPLEKFVKLSLSPTHPSAFLYLRHAPGFGCTPSAGRRWQQIRKLEITVEAWDFYGPSPGLDQLKIIDDYIRIFAGCVEKFTFIWLGRSGPCPLSFAADPLLAPPAIAPKVVTKPIQFRKLRYLSVRNTTMDAPQLDEIMRSHQKCVYEFDFQDIVLVNGGLWCTALAPLMRTGRWAAVPHGTKAEEPSTGFKIKRQRKYKWPYADPTPISSSSSKMTISAPILDTRPAMPILLQPTVHHPVVAEYGDVTAVQRKIEAEEAQYRQNHAPKASVLHKAHEAVLDKRSERSHGHADNSSSSPTRVRFRLDGDEHHQTTSTVSMSTDVRSMEVPIFWKRFLKRE